MACLDSEDLNEEKEGTASISIVSADILTQSSRTPKHTRRPVERT